MLQRERCGINNYRFIGAMPLYLNQGAARQLGKVIRFLNPELDLAGKFRFFSSSF